MVTNVILVDEADQQIGIMEKMEAHQQGVLHRAFSVFILNSRNQMLLQRRALEKYHSPGLWTNACCSHPSPDESTLSAAKRRLDEEMNITCSLQEIGSFTYKATFENGLTENEFDHVLIGRYDGEVAPNPAEVVQYDWLSLGEIDKRLQHSKTDFTFWFHLAYPIVKRWLNRDPS